MSFNTAAQPVSPATDVADAPVMLTLGELKRMAAEARDMTAQARREAEIDIDYRDGYQWTATERRVLAERKQPDLVFNRVRPAVAGMLGVLKQGKTDPKAYGRNPDDDDSADVATKVLRYIADKSDFHSIRTDCADDYLVPGVCAAIVEGTKDGKVPIVQIRWEEYFYDPRSRRRDFADKRYDGVAKWMYADQVKKLYPKADGEIEGSIDGAGVPVDTAMADRPMAQAGSWYDKKLRRVMLVEMYFKAEVWMRYVFYGGGILECGVSPYKDLDGKPCDPIEAQSCFIDRENNRFGVVRDMRGPQDEVNKRRSKLMHILNNRQVVAESEIALNVDSDTVRSEAARPDGVLPMGWKPVSMTDVASGHMQLMQEAKQEIERQAPNPAILGRLNQGESGRAQLVRQQSGMTELAMVFGGIEAWELRIYRQMWARAKQFYTAPDYVRITDDVGSAQFVGINQPQHGPAQVGMHPETGVPTIYRPVMGYKNKLAEMDVDITLDVTPHTANVEQEQFQALVDLRRSGVPIDPMLLIECSSLPNKGQIIEKMKAQQEQPPSPEQQMQAQGAQAEIALKQASANHHNAQAQLLAADIPLKNAMAMRTAAQTRNEVHKPVADMFKAGVDAGQEAIQNQSDHMRLNQEKTSAGLEHYRQMLGLQDRNNNTAAG